MKQEVPGGYGHRGGLIGPGFECSRYVGDETNMRKIRSWSTTWRLCWHVWFPQGREDLWKMNSNCILKYSIKD